MPQSGLVPADKTIRFDCKSQPYHISLSPDELTLTVMLFFLLYIVLILMSWVAGDIKKLRQAFALLDRAA